MNDLEKTPPPRPRWPRLALMLLAALLVPIVPFALIGELPGERWLSRYDDDALIFGAAGAVLLCSDVLLPIPSSLIGSLLGGRLGFALGFCWTWLGLMTGSIIGYALGRLLPARFANELPRAPSLLVLFLSRPVPVFAEAAAITAGAERLTFLGFLFATAAGNLLYAAAMAGNGAALLPSGLAGPGLIAPMSVPVLAWLAWRALRKRRSQVQ